MQRTHGERRGGTNGDRTPEYKAWANMRQRCNNPRVPQYAYYGARGIKIDPAWDTYEQFLKDMGRRPTEYHTLERIDNNLGYSKGNCIWATKSQQQRNTRAYNPLKHRKP
jgi:hypothetical protein